jgi:hypothetical protein
MLAEAYRRGLMRPEQAHAYEVAALRGAVNDPYAAARADESSSARGVNRGASLTFTGAIPFLNEGGAAMAAGAGAIGNMLNQRPADFGGEWNRARAMQQGYQDQYAAEHPISAVGMKTAGLAAQIAAAMGTGGASEAASAATAARTGLAASARRMATSVARNATLGGGVAAVNAAAQPGTLRQRAVAADNAFLPGAALGAVVPIASSALPGSIAAVRRAGTSLRDGMDALTGSQAVRGPKIPSPASALASEGIPITLGQRLGGPFLKAENQTALLPRQGSVIREAQAIGQQGLNRALANRALAPIGLTLPANVPVGQAAADFVNAKVARAREIAPDGIDSVEPDARYAGDVQAMLAKAERVFPEELSDHFASLVSDTADKLNNGAANSETIKDIFKHIDEEIDGHIDSPNADEDAYGLHLQNYRDKVAALAGRQNPDFMADYAAAERAKLIANLFSDATARAGDDPNGFSPADLLQAHDALPTSHISDLAAGALPDTLDLADRANLVMGAPAVSAGTATRPTLLGAGLIAAAKPNAAAGPAVANAFEIAPPGGVAERLAQRNAFVPNLMAGLTAGGGLSVAATSKPQQQPLVAGVQ